MSATKPMPQPGRKRKAALEEMIRVDHAGEYGAVQIYKGQLAVFGRLPQTQKIAATLRRQHDEEEAHLARFDEIVNERGIRPTAFAPLWHVAGFALGAATALMGEKAAHACTAAIEEVIDEHYSAQVAALDKQGGETELRETIESFRRDEVRHRDEAIEAGAHEAPGARLLGQAIKTACRVAIRLSEKA
jgi:ubiquinone biosynthesis monooxygenase Coq7